MKSTYHRLPLILASLLALTACAAKPPKPAPAPAARSGEEMIRESQGIAQMGERWLSGKKKVEHGEEMVREGQARISEGQREIEEGRRVMKESESGYQGIKK